jgi:hypothetical protein
MVKGKNTHHHQQKNTLQSLLTVEYKGLKIHTNIAHHYIIQFTTSKTVHLIEKV